MDKTLIGIKSIINQMAKNPHRVAERLKTHPQIGSRLEQRGQKDGATGAGKKKETVKKKEDPLQQLAAAEVDSTPDVYVELGTIFSNAEGAKMAAAPLVAATEDLVEEEKENKKQAEPIQLIEKAENTLTKVDISPATENVDAVAKALARVDDQVRRLTDQIAATKKQKR